MSETPQFEGILPALITPLTEGSAEVDHEALMEIVSGLGAAGVSGFVPCGSTGEFITLSNDERRAVVETVIEAAGELPVVPHTGALSTATAVALSVHAERAGAAAVMVVPPFYEPLTFRELLAHYATIRDAVSIPVMYYHLPGATGVELSFAQFQALQREAGISSLKDTSGNASGGMELIQRGDEGPTLLNGMDSLTFSALAAGARAAIWGAANFIPRQAVELHRLLAIENDLEGARRVWREIYPICRFLELTSYSVAVKEACNLIGLPAGPVRRPLLPLESGDREELSAVLADAHLQLAAAR